MGKSFKSVLKILTETHVEEHNLPNLAQYRFRKGHSTEEALNDVIERLSRLRSTHKLIAVIFLFIKGTFDSDNFF